MLLLERYFLSSHSGFFCRGRCPKQAEKVGEVSLLLFPASPAAGKLFWAGRWAIANVSIHQQPCSRIPQWSASLLLFLLKARRMESPPPLSVSPPAPPPPPPLPLLIKVIHAKSAQHPAACGLFGCPGASDSVFSKCDLLIFVDRR